MELRERWEPRNFISRKSIIVRKSWRSGILEVGTDKHLSNSVVLKLHRALGERCPGRDDNKHASSLALQSIKLMHDGADSNKVMNEEMTARIKLPLGPEPRQVC